LGTGDLRIVFMGTPDFARASLAGLVAAGEHVVAVVTQPDRPKGRSREPSPPPVKVFAEAHGIQVLQPRKVRSDAFLGALRRFEPDVLVVAAYGRILPPSILELAPHGAINVHASLLPRHRGAAPIHAAVIAGDAETGITLMQMDEGLDTGDILLQRALPILPDDTTGALHDRLAALGAETLVEGLALLRQGALVRRPQDASLATYAPQLAKEDGQIDWSLGPAALSAFIRGMLPWPGAFTWLGGRRLLVHPLARTSDEPPPPGTRPGTVLTASHSELCVACGGGRVWLGDVQIEGRKRVDVSSFLRGFSVPVGARLGERPE
jgi:methionyl-tRNA formyltransferase